MSKAAPAALARRLRRATKPSTASSASVTTNRIRAARLAYAPARKSAIETKARATLINVIRFGDIKAFLRKKPWSSSFSLQRSLRSKMDGAKLKIEHGMRQAKDLTPCHVPGSSIGVPAAALCGKVVAPLRLGRSCGLMLVSSGAGFL